LQPDQIIIGEPSGWNNLVLGYKGNARIEFEMEKDRNHVSSPEPNCIEHAVRLYNRLMEFAVEYNTTRSLFHELTIRLTDIDSPSDPFSESVHVELDVRIPPGFDMGVLTDLIEMEKGPVQVKVEQNSQPVMRGRSNPLVSAFNQAILARGGHMGFRYRAGTSDMNILQDFNVPMVTYGPGNSTLDHTKDEHLHLHEYDTSVKVLKEVLMKVCSV